VELHKRAMSVPPVRSTKEVVHLSYCHGLLSTALIENLPANHYKCIATCSECTTALALCLAIGKLEGIEIKITRSVSDQFALKSSSNRVNPYPANVENRVSSQ
jgi:hypothetical protein